MKAHKLRLASPNYVSTGSTMLNLACTDSASRGLRKGHYYLLVGDSRSGKTWLALSVLAEAARNRAFDNHRLIYDDVEGGALMKIERFFGKKLADRLEPPARDSEGAVFSHTIETFYHNLDDVCQEDRPFIYVLDSHDCLDSDFAKQKFEEQKTATREGTDAAGSYGDGKAKINSGTLRRFMRPLQQKGSILIIINQTRDRLGTGRMAYGKTTAGGWALHFYATYELWTSIEGDITKTVRGQKMSQGVITKVRVKKNRQTGKDRVVTFPIFTTHGIDDVGSCVDFLIAQKQWSMGKTGIIDAEDIKLKGRKETIIEQIEERGLETRLHSIVSKVWNEIEQALVVSRKPRYT